MGQASRQPRYTTHLCIRIVSYCSGLGIADSELLDRTGLTLQSLFDNATRVTLAQTCQVADNALRLTADAALGLKISRDTRPEDGGVAALASSTAGTFWQRARTHERYYRLTGQILFPFWTTEDDAQVYRLTPPEPLGHLLPFFVEESFCSLRESINHNHRVNMIPDRLRLAYEAPAYQRDYQLYFQCPLEFNAADNELVFDFLALPEREFPGRALNFSLYEQMCEAMEREAGIVERVKSTLTRTESNGTLETIASDLGITSRTLSRQLEEAGYSFRQLKDEARISRSIQLLDHTNMPVEQVAQATGFRSVRRFREFFLKHTGQTPSAYRRGKSL